MHDWATIFCCAKHVFLCVPGDLGFSSGLALPYRIMDGEVNDLVSLIIGVLFESITLR